ncbi:MAG: hypothetical protein AWU57_930 [Marinobacter sp. T13-3]|nr:MAG: hypothetical protein AWU57_930 [Marinobacter sp. T13-3]
MFYALKHLIVQYRSNDLLAHYKGDDSPGPFDDVPYPERGARELLHSLYKDGVDQVFVVTGANGLSAQIVDAHGDLEPPRDGWLKEYRALLELTDDAANSILDWCSSQPGLLTFDQSHGRLRRATINVIKAGESNLRFTQKRGAQRPGREDFNR